VWLVEVSLLLLPLPLVTVVVSLLLPLLPLEVTPPALLGGGGGRGGGAGDDGAPLTETGLPLQHSLDVLVAGGLLQLAAVHPVTEGVNYSDPWVPSARARSGRCHWPTHYCPHF